MRMLDPISAVLDEIETERLKNLNWIVYIHSCGGNDKDRFAHVRVLGSARSDAITIRARGIACNTHRRGHFPVLRNLLAKARLEERPVQQVHLRGVLDD